MKKIIYIILLSLLLVSCEKLNPGDCFKNSGQVKEEKRELATFSYLNMNNNVDVFITYAPSYSVVVRAGSNVIPGIKTEVSQNTLTITNENSCNWVRSYDKPIEVHISTPVLDTIVYQASGNLTFVNEFRADSIKLDVLEGAGSIHLWLNTTISTCNLHYGTADLNVKGTVHISYLYSGGYGPADLRNLSTGYTFMTSNSTNNCFVNCSGELEVKLNNVGDVYYFGNPPTVSLFGTGTGMLIKQ